MSVAFFSSAIVLYVVFVLWLRAERGWKDEADQHMSALRSEADVRRQRDEMARQRNEARAAAAALEAQNVRLLGRLNVAETVAAQKASELDGLREGRS